MALSRLIARLQSFRVPLHHRSSKLDPTKAAAPSSPRQFSQKSGMSKYPVSEGIIPFTYTHTSSEGKSKTYDFKTWYKVTGDLSNTTRTPLITLHGGPGLIHDALIPFSDLTRDKNIPVIFYDQIGNGRSTHLRGNKHGEEELPQDFWKLDLFVEELTNLIKHFKIQSSFDLVGHSWGGILALEFAKKNSGTELKLRRLILTSSLASSALWKQSNDQLMEATTADATPEAEAEAEAAYVAIKKLHTKHGCNVGTTEHPDMPAEWVACLDAVFGKDKGDPTVAGTMDIKDWSSIEYLHTIRVPTFVINGRKDISQDFVVAPFFEKIDKVKWVTFENSGHGAFWEERERYMQHVGQFLTYQ